ncbi:matrix protein [Datura yellow vein nucleorhabdovirus]|uniref:Matrix protein n=1 Tax=Datura yellow vein nucleorhabdovirus TaxID=195059 RepID=A0A0F7LE78_9RHAB|nr:matrix protein [Datura yellow vein nucleorhabdovirus]AKH61404.1 matrix protein [Datura yellow vein nucleorhabdovirus]
MEPASFSIKGNVGLTFKKKRDSMHALTLWDIVTKMWNMYPERVVVSFSTTRNSADKSPVEDPLVIAAIQKMVEGCVKSYNIKCSVGRSVNLLLGDCYKYAIALGTSSKDTGHETIILTLPFSMKGCYRIHAEVSNHMKKDGVKEHYMLGIGLEAYIGDMDTEGYNAAIKHGICIYPFMIEHPELFSKSITSDSEMSSDGGHYVAGPSAVMRNKKRRKQKMLLKSAKPYLSGRATSAKKVLNALRLAGNKIYEEYTTTDGDEAQQQGNNTPSSQEEKAPATVPTK